MQSSHRVALPALPCRGQRHERLEEVPFLKAEWRNWFGMLSHGPDRDQFKNTIGHLQILLPSPFSFPSFGGAGSVLRTA